MATIAVADSISCDIVFNTIQFTCWREGRRARARETDW